MKNLMFTLLLVMMGVVCANAQKSGLAVQLGAAANYYYGPGNSNLKDFKDNRLNYQVNGMVGLTILRDKNDHRTMIAGFGSAGLTNRSTLNQIFTDQNYITSPLVAQDKNNVVYRLEGGLLIAEILRLSTGVGQQVFSEQILVNGNNLADIRPNAKSLQYYSSTIGFNLGFSAVALTIDCNFQYGKDFNNTVIVPTAGLSFRF